MVYHFLLVFFSNFVPKTHRFWDIRLQKCRDLETWLGVNAPIQSRPNAKKLSAWVNSKTIGYFGSGACR